MHGAVAQSALESQPFRVAHFEFSHLMLSRLRTVDPGGRRFLLREGQSSRYRFCPACLAEQRIKYFRLEWRFECWHWCPLHSCLLEAHCPHCNRPISLPVDMPRGGPEALGIATLEHCFTCGKRLTVGWKERVQLVHRLRLQPLDRCLLSNGRAVLSALFHGKFRVGDDERNWPLKHLKMLYMKSLIPHNWHPPRATVDPIPVMSMPTTSSSSGS